MPINFGGVETKRILALLEGVWSLYDKILITRNSGFRCSSVILV